MLKGIIRTGSERSSIFKELLASVVVFLIALPLCMGIAVACGVPPALGIITGIVGGLVAGGLSGCRLQVSGPAAGLTVIVFDLIQAHGLAVLGVVVLAAGAIQALAGLLRLGKWFRAVSPAVIRGMLAGIGVLIVAAQFHVMFDIKPGGSGLPNLLSVPQTLYKLFGGGVHWQAGLVAGATFASLLVWKISRLEALTKIPAPLVAIVAGSALAFAGGFQIAYIDLPDRLQSAVSLPTTSTLSQLLEHTILLSALTLALIASAESLLSAAAVDQMHNGQRANFDRELISQGVGNMLCGTLGALPMTGVIVRSSVNVQAGAKTRLSAMLHGLWLLLAVVAFAAVLRMVPIASLAALLVYTGWKLVDIKSIKELRQFGHSELLIYAFTAGTIVATDLLTGVMVGLLLSLAKVVLNVCRLETDLKESGPKAQILVLKGAATFLALPKLNEALGKVQPGVNLTLETCGLSYIDHACLDALKQWHARQSETGGGLSVDWQVLTSRTR